MVNGFYLSCQLRLIESCAEKDSQVTSVLNGEEKTISQERSPRAQKRWQPPWQVFTISSLGAR